MRINFTAQNIARIAPPDRGRAFHYDTKTPGLAVQVTAAGTRTFYVYRWVQGKPERTRLGAFPAMTVEIARARAAEVNAIIAKGESPRARKKDKKARAVTLGQVFEDYLTAHDLKPDTVYDYRKVVRTAFADWLDRPVTDITRDMISARHKKLEDTKATANKAMRVLRALLNFAAAKLEDARGRPLITDNPVRRLSATREWYRVERKRTLIKPHQLAPWFRAVASLAPWRDTGTEAVTRDYLQFILFTGLRKGEAARLELADVDIDGRSFIVRDTKNREPHELPMPEFVQELLVRRREAADGSPFVFPGERGGCLSDPRRPMAAVTAQSGVAFTLHDLRRTFITVAESLDIPAYALKRLLNHKPGADVTAGYIVMDTERLREPMERIARYLLKAAGLEPSAEVVELTERTA
jgi:integrase